MVNFSPDATVEKADLLGQIDGTSYINPEQTARYHVNIYVKFSMMEGS